MERIKLFFLNNKKIFLIICVLIVIIVAFLTHRFYFQKNIEEEILPEIIEEKEEENEEIAIEFIKVDIKGQIKKPGVYQIEKSLDRRINDVILMAGGLTNNADTSVTNLSKKLFDEMIIIIYSKDEVQDFVKTKEVEKIKNTECAVNNCDSCITNNDNNNETNETKLININTATKEELMTISGLGESKAQSIIEYREHNRFVTIEDIMNVSGIGESLFNKIKDYITV